MAERDPNGACDITHRDIPPSNPGARLEAVIHEHRNHQWEMVGRTLPKKVGRSRARGRRRELARTRVAARVARRSLVLA
jgi:hypothetical protein